jgi:plastocyanin
MKTAIYLLLLLMVVVVSSAGVISCSSAAVTTTHGNTQTSPPPGQTSGPDFKPAAVSIENFAFAPDALTVPIGTTVTWTNNDNASHTVISDTPAFESPSLPKGGDWSFTFDKAGVYKYHCTVHPGMKGTVTVE